MHDLDYDLSAALTYNELIDRLDLIEGIVAVIEGENDGPPWHWIVKLKDGTYSYITGGCDYTGWDCQSNCTMYPATATVEEALDDVEDDWRSNGRQTQLALIDQLTNGKLETWREKKDKEFGVKSVFVSEHKDYFL